MAHITYSNTDENRFWLQIIGDYARLVIRAFSPDETGDIQQARAFIDQFDSLLVRARQNLTADQLAALNKEAFTATLNIQKFFLRLLGMQVKDGHPFFLTPSVMDNAITFTAQYLYLLNSFINNKQPDALNAIQLDTFWLPVFIQIAKIISDSLGIYQVKPRQKLDHFASLLTGFFLSSVELQGITRIGTSDFPIIHQYKKDLNITLTDFSRDLESLIALKQQNRIPGVLSGLYLDRSYRLICYYLRQQAVLADSEQPGCDPARPRLCNL